MSIMLKYVVKRSILGRPFINLPTDWEPEGHHYASRETKSSITFDPKVQRAFRATAQHRAVRYIPCAILTL